MRYAPKKSYIWSNNIAYAVGLIASDGSLSKDGRHIDLTSKDVEQLENFRIALNRNFNISDKWNKSGETAKRIQFSDVAFYDFLVAAGMTPNKSLTIKEVHVPTKYYQDFLRGLFDGDGSLYAFKDKRWRSSFMFYTFFYSGSLEFLKFIQQKNIEIVGITGSIGSASRAYKLQYAKTESKKLARFMYSDPACLKLTRKHKKLFEFITTDENARIH